jgi:excisionase family DNA binding protein
LEELMNVKEAASYLRLNYMTVYKLAQKRVLPACKVGGNWRFRKDILDDWMQKKTNTFPVTVMVVDDDLMIQEILKSIIENQGYTVFTAGTGEKALELVERQHFDLIFLDLKLPGMSGVAILEAIKSKDKESVVVIVTAFADDPIALKAMSLGPLLMIRKPFREKDILEVLNMVFKTSRTSKPSSENSSSPG